MSVKIKAKSFTREDIAITADAVMVLIKTKLDVTMDIAQIVIQECQHRILQEKELRFNNPG